MATQIVVVAAVLSPLLARAPPQDVGGGEDNAREHAARVLTRNLRRFSNGAKKERSVSAGLGARKVLGRLALSWRDRRRRRAAELALLFLREALLSDSFQVTVTTPKDDPCEAPWRRESERERAVGGRRRAAVVLSPQGSGGGGWDDGECQTRKHSDDEPQTEKGRGGKTERVSHESHLRQLPTNEASGASTPSSFVVLARPPRSREEDEWPRRAAHATIGVSRSILDRRGVLLAALDGVRCCQLSVSILPLARSLAISVSIPSVPLSPCLFALSLPAGGHLSAKSRPSALEFS